MPQQYAGQGNYRVSCNDCHVALVTHGYPRRDSVIVDYVGGTGARTPAVRVSAEIERYFTWDRNGDRFYSICKQCKAARIARRRAEWAAREAASEAAPIATTPNTGRRFGIELEVISPISHVALGQKLTDAGLVGWRVKYDGSLSGGGAEIVSPVLQGDDGREQVRKVCRVLRQANCTVNRSCGLHVHHEIRDMTIGQVKGLARLWSDNQDVIDGLVAPSRRGGTNTYCGRLSSHDLASLARCDRLERVSQHVTTRYRTLNLASYGRYGTVEIRQHQGTMDAEKVLTWLAFGQAMIEAARSQTAFRSSRASDLVSNLTTLDDTAGTYLLGRAVRFAAVAI